MGMDKALHAMSLEALRECSVREMTNYRRKLPSDASYCLEILRRAIEQRDEVPWQVLQRHYS